MIGAADRYLQLVTELLLQRALADGTLPEDSEVTYVDELDRCWWAMTKEEQDEADRAVTCQPPDEASVELGERDTVVSRGAKQSPRQKVPKAA